MKEDLNPDAINTVLSLGFSLTSSSNRAGGKTASTSRDQYRHIVTIDHVLYRNPYEYFIIVDIRSDL